MILMQREGFAVTTHRTPREGIHHYRHRRTCFYRERYVSKFPIVSKKGAVHYDRLKPILEQFWNTRAARSSYGKPEPPEFEEL
jgi:hypothetical protein